MRQQDFDSKVLRRMEQFVALERLRTPGDIAPMVVLLASDVAGFLTGQVTSVSGGLTMVG
jgi:2-hydroxycyclohexanecarboxyl-CoA dehydrogenase